MSNGWVHHALDDAIELIATLGYRAFGLTPDVCHLDPFRATPAQLRRLRRRLEQRDLAVAIETGARFLLDPWHKHEPTLLSAEPGARQRRLAFYERALDIAAALGAPLVSLWSGVAPPGASPAECQQRLVDGLRAVCERAEQAGLRVAFEPEPGMFVETLAHYEVLAAAVDRPALGLTIDLGHLQCVEVPPLAQHLRHWAPALIHVHADDIRGHEHRHLAIGEGEIDFPALATALREIGYGGMVLVELSRDSHRAPEVAREAYRRLAPLLGV